jgi:lactate permease
LNVVLLLWPGVFLYFLVDQIGGIRAIALALQGMVHDRGWLLVLEAWMLSAILESLAGFGLPIAMVAPLLITLGVSPVMAVASTAIGHTWAGSTGGMALSLRILSEITHYTPEALFPDSAILLGISMILTGLAVAFLLGQKQQWWRVLITGLVVGVVHYVLGILGMISISALLASFVGFTFGSWISKKSNAPKTDNFKNSVLRAGLIAYGVLVAIMLVVSLVPRLNQVMSSITWTLQFPAVVSGNGTITPAESGNLLHVLTHPGTLVIFTILFTLVIFHFLPSVPHLDLKRTFNSTLRSALPASLGSLFMIGLSTIMEHSGMTLTLAKSLSGLVGGIYPVFSPLVGMIGSFATGSNVNSNVLFGALQKQVAVLVGASPIVILAAQTTGGSLGSMIAPAKLAVGTSTNELKGREGEVLRYTLPVGLAIALVVGLAALAIS